MEGDSSDEEHDEDDDPYDACEPCVRVFFKTARIQCEPGNTADSCAACQKAHRPCARNDHAVNSPALRRALKTAMKFVAGLKTSAEQDEHLFESRGTRGKDPAVRPLPTRPHLLHTDFLV